jgi:hypothetical protein
MAQTAVSAIRSTCQFLSEGKAEIGKFKKQLEGGVADAKAIFKEVTGIWGWITGLFGANPKLPASPVAKQVTLTNEGNIDTSTKRVEKKLKNRREPEPELSYEEFQARSVHEICENLKVYFEAIRHLKAHCRELEEEALTTEKVADSAIDRIEMQWQMKELNKQLKQAMIYGTPQELGLGAMYQEFLLKYDEILEEQEVARELKLKRERDTEWRHEHRKEILIAKLMYATAALVVMLEMIGLYFVL